MAPLAVPLAVEIPWGPISAVMGAILLFLGTYLTLRKGKADAQAASAKDGYDQLQEDNETLRNTVKEERTMRFQADARVRLRDNYIALLRMHINRGEQPPPPDFPKDWE